MNHQSSFRRANRIASIEISEIVQLTEQANTLRATGKDILALSTGEPDFPTPAHVIVAANKAALNGLTRYPATMGAPALRDPIADMSSTQRENVIISTGAKQVLANAMLATLNPGDEVIIPAPYWTSYSDIVALAYGIARVIPCAMNQGYKLTPAQLKAAIKPQSRWLMLNSPSNPSGAIYTAAELQAFADVLRDHPNVMILVDEIYRHLSYTAFVSFVDIAPDLQDRILIVDGVSKAYSMTGWRIGWGIGPAAMIKAMGAVQGQVTSGASSISQAAALEAISGDQSLLKDRLDIFTKRRDMVVSSLNDITGITCLEPDGAFYAFPNIEGAIKRKVLDSDAAFCRALLDQTGLAIVPGRAFGAPGHARISFACAESALEDGLSRLTAFMNEN